MAENLDKKLCAHYRASRNVEESERENTDFKKWGCYECDGYKTRAECTHNTPLEDVMFDIKEEEK